MRSIARLMQMLALALVPLAIVLQLGQRISVAQLLLMGLAAFWLEGWALPAIVGGIAVAQKRACVAAQARYFTKDCCLLFVHDRWF